ncbi:MAG TPA: methylmalonyl-CoA mutase family protein, partial [Thermoanaerobaculia bacterium]|nr:methylmalonyl-CoA mutase family protein [Thermoanaerobaculia bacterium]
VNAFREEGDVRPPLMSIDPSVEKDQVERLAAFRARRDSESTRASLARLRVECGDDRNLMPPILDAVTAGATLGEVVSTLKSVYGEYRADS